VGQVVYRETQRLPAPWRWPLAVLAFAGVAAGVWTLRQDGVSAAGLIGLTAGVIGASVGLLCVTARLDVEVTVSSVEVRWAPLTRRSIPYARIADVEAVVYQPIRQFGGWGIRFGRAGARAYSMSGDHAVKVTLVDGTEVFLGSLEPEALAGAIRRAIHR
jgi:hypothetical protein